MIPHRFLRFAVVGVGAVGLNLLLFALLVGRLGIPYLWATVLIFVLVNGYGFIANRRWVFRVADRPGRRMIRYYATMAASLGLNLLSMAALVGGLGIGYLVASVITSAWLAPVLYLAHGRVAFRRDAARDPGTKPRILLVTHYYPEHGGGVEIVAGKLAALLGGDFEIEWRASGAPGTGGEVGVSRRPMRCWNWLERHAGLPIPVPSPLATAAVVRAARRADCVWIHDLIYPANLAAAVGALTAGTPLFVTIHVGAIPYRNRVVRSVMAAAVAISGSLLLTRAAVVAFVSERVRSEFLARWRLRNEELIPNGVDVVTFAPPAAGDRDRTRAALGLTSGDPAPDTTAPSLRPAGRHIVLFVGRFVERKGLRLLHEVAAATPSITWLFAGHGPLDPGDWHLPNVRVERTRSGATLAELYAAADLLVLPSVGEGFPLVVGEALAVGLPVLVDPSTVAGYPAVAAVAESEPAIGPDAAARWQTRIETMLDAGEDEDVAARSARVAFAREHWSWDAGAAEYRRLFGAILASDGAGSDVAQGRE